jgi:CelD/BcsL family acetyltransferase involved in cellulose biosynthesis
MSEWSIEWLTNWSDVWSPTFMEKWKRAFAEDTHPLASPFNHPSVVKAWCLSHRADERLEPRFMVATHPQGHWAMIPFVFTRPKWQLGFITEIAPVGKMLFDYHDPIIAPVLTDADVEESFWRAVRCATVLQPGKGADSVAWPRSRRAKRFTEWSLGGQAPFLDLRKYSSYEAYLASRKQSLRSDLRRQAKRMSALGPFRYESMDSVGEGTVIEWARSMKRFRDQRYGHTGDGGLPWPYLERLLRESFRSDGPLHMSALYIGDRDVSWHLGFRSHARQYMYIWSFDNEFADISPGKIHLNLAIMKSFEIHHDEFDFLMGLEGYKFGWTDGEQHDAVGFLSETPSPIFALKKSVKEMNRRAKALLKRR